MARRIRTHLLSALLAATGAIAGGCAVPATYSRAPAPSFAQATPSHTTESWATVLPLPRIEQSAAAMARRDDALGLPPSGYTRVAGAWRVGDRPTLERYLLIHVPRNDRTLLFFTPPAHNERRAPRVPRRAHPWHTAW